MALGRNPIETGQVHAPEDLVRRMVLHVQYDQVIDLVLSRRSFALGPDRTESRSHLAWR